MTQQIQHAERDHRFAYISAGDISFWSKATTPAHRPKVKNKHNQHHSAHITDLDALREAAAKLTVSSPSHDPKTVVLLASDDDGGVVGAMKKCDKVVAIAHDRIAISDMINRILMPDKFSKYQRKQIG